MKTKYKVAIDSSPLTSGHKSRGIGVQLTELFSALESTNSEFEFEPVDFSNKSLTGYDIVTYSHFHPYFDSYLGLEVDSKKVAVIDDLIPLIYPKNYPPGFKGRRNLTKNKNSLKQIDAVITISETSKKDIVRFLKYPAEKIFVTHLAADKRFKEINNKTLLSSVKKKYKLPRRFVLYVGDINYNKNLKTLILATKKAKIPLVIVGKHAKELAEGNTIKYQINGPMDYIRFAFNKPHPELAHLSELSGLLKDKNITLTGFVSNNEQVAIYNLATLYCQPSLYEGFGLPILEALSSGTPVVASKINVFKEIADDAVEYFDPKDANALTGKINKVLKSKKLRDNLIKKGKRKAKEYSWHKTANKTLHVYRKVVKTN